MRTAIIHSAQSRDSQRGVARIPCNVCRRTARHMGTTRASRLASLTMQKSNRLPDASSRPRSPQTSWVDAMPSDATDADEDEEAAQACRCLAECWALGHT